MKSFKSAVFTVAAALFLVVSFSGCKDNDAQTASNASSASAFSISEKEGVADSNGMVSFYLPQGTRSLEIKFRSSEDRNANMKRVEKMLAEAGIEGSFSYGFPKNQYVQMKTLEKRVRISLPSEIRSVAPYGMNGLPVFEWNYVEGFVYDRRA